MAYFITGSGLITEYGKLTGSTPTQIILRDSAVTVASIICTETAGGTPNLSIEVYSPADAASYFLRNAVAMTAKQTVTYAEPFVVQNGDYLRLTSSAALGSVDYFVNYFNPDATRQQT